MTLRLGAVAALVIGLAGCASGGFGDAFQPDVYRVRPGDTIYSIAWRYQIDPDDLLAWNDIDDPDTLRVGRRLRLDPDARLPGSRAAGTQTRTPQAAADPPDPKPAPTRDDSPASAASSQQEPRATGGDATGARQWRWPARGEVVGTFDDGRVAGRGIDIAGDLGQPVQATAAGEVVYSGEGLQAYGRLVIIRHSGDYLSAYAHNSELLVREGQRVTAGQQIARMGTNADREAMLHFEIRRRGKPVDPLQYLPDQ